MSDFIDSITKTVLEFFDRFWPYSLKIDASYVIYFGMALLLMWGIFGIFTNGDGFLRLVRCSHSLKKAWKTLQKQSIALEIRKDLLQGESAFIDFLFTQKHLRHQLLMYASEIKNTESSGVGACYCGIGEFFNYDLLDQLGGSKVNDFVSSGLTALGILGTFWGLIHGLSGFDASSTETIMSGINNLLEGMSFAFYTSIVGITCSVLYSFLYKNTRAKAERYLDSFVDVFDSSVLSSHQESVLNQISDSVRSLDFDRFTKNFSDSMDSAMGQMKDIVNNFSSVAANEVVRTTELMAKAFVNKMNELMEDKLSELAYSFNQTAQASNACRDSLKEVVKDIQLTQNSISKLHEEILSMAEEYKKISLEIENIRSSFSEDAKMIRTRMDSATRLVREEQRLIDKYIDFETTMTNDESTINESLEKVSKSLDAVSRLIEGHMSSLRTASENYEQTLTNKSEEYISYLKDEQVEFQKASMSMLQSLTGMITELNRQFTVNKEDNAQYIEKINGVLEKTLAQHISLVDVQSKILSRLEETLKSQGKNNS